MTPSRLGYLICFTCLFIHNLAEAQSAPQQEALDRDSLIENAHREQARKTAEIHDKTMQMLRNEMATTTPMIELDPQLKKAWDYFNDRDNRRRDVAIQYFEDYLKEHPDSMYRFDVYFHIGQLYSSHRKSENGEEYRPDLMTRYYSLAHEGYGLKYSPLNRCAWASINNQPSRTLADRLEYYQWLLRLEREGSADDIYPAVDMGIIASGNRASREWTQNERQQQIENVRRELKKIISVAEENIVEKSRPDDLHQIIDLYPATSFAKIAQKKLDVVQDVILRHTDESIRSASFSQTAETVPAAGRAEHRNDLESIHLSATSAPENGGSGEEKWPILAISIGLILASIIFIWIVRRRHSASS